MSVEVAQRPLLGDPPMRGCVRNRSVARMLPVLRLSLLTLAILLFSTAAAQAAKPLTVVVPAEGQVAVAVGSGATSVKVKSAPAGVTVAGGIKKGRLAVAVLRPRGVAAKGKVVLTLKGSAKGVKTFAAALDSGSVSAGCGDLAGLLGKRLKGTADVKPLGAVLAAKLCGKTPPANTADVLAKLGLGAAPAPPAPPAPASGSGPSPRPAPAPPRPPATTTPVPTATATPTPPAGKRACDNKLDDDGDGQTDWEDPGCSDAGDMTENSEVPVSAACAATSGIGMGDDPTELTVGINPECGLFWEAEVQVAPGVASCEANNDYECVVYDPIASAHDYDHQRDAVDMTLQLKGPVDCSKKATIALHRVEGGKDMPVTELQMFVRNCKQLPMPKPKCANGKDDDGDGMIDSRDAAGTTDPDPGCTSATDTSENSETEIPEWCDVRVGAVQGDKRLVAMSAEGCGVIAGAWFRPPGTPTDCGYWFGQDGDVADCAIKAGTIGTTFALTSMKFTMATHLAADYDCRPITVALLQEGGGVMSGRVPFC